MKYELEDPLPYGVTAFVREAAVVLVLAAVASGIVVYERTSPAAARRVVRVAPGPAKETFSTPAEAQEEAIRRYPRLGVQGSVFNRQFVGRYNFYRQTKPAFFRDPAWPVRLADEVGAALDAKAKAAGPGSF